MGKDHLAFDDGFHRADEPAHGCVLREIPAKSGLESPVDIAGSSLGGSMALEAARRGLARSAVAIAPPGLWKERPAPHVKYVFGGMRFIARHAPAVLRAAVRLPFLRELTLAVPISIGSRHMPVSDALRAVDDLKTARAFEETFENTRAPLALAGITVPVTVAFGDRDWILPKCSQRRTGLPAHATWVIKRGWGHVPTWIDPAGVAHLILDGTRSPADPRPSIAEVIGGRRAR